MNYKKALRILNAYTTQITDVERVLRWEDDGKIIQKYYPKWGKIVVYEGRSRSDLEAL